MSELIDIWETIELLSDKRSDCNFFVDGQTAYEALSDMIKAVKELPRIDLVRCGECKFMSEHYDTDGNLPYLICLEWDSGTDIDGYCYLGERRTDDKTEESRP